MSDQDDTKDAGGSGTDDPTPSPTPRKRRHQWQNFPAGQGAHGARLRLPMMRANAKANMISPFGLARSAFVKQAEEAYVASYGGPVPLWAASLIHEAADAYGAMMRIRAAQERDPDYDPLSSNAVELEKRVAAFHKARADALERLGLHVDLDLAVDLRRRMGAMGGGGGGGVDPDARGPGGGE